MPERNPLPTMNILLSFLHILLVSLIELLYLFGILMAVGFILGVLERYASTFLVRTFGPRAVLVTAWIGTPIHEIGHLIQCFIWGHRVTRVKLLQVNSPTGVLGYVEHSYNRNSMFQKMGNFFIGMGPIFSGIGALVLGMYLLVPKSYIVFNAYIHQHVSLEILDVNVVKMAGGAVFALTKGLFTVENLINPLFWLFLVLAISISSHIALSKADIQGSARGLLMIFFVLVLFNIVSGVLQLDSYRMIVKLAEYNAYILAFSSIALFFSLINLALSFLFYLMKKYINPRI